MKPHIRSTVLAPALLGLCCVLPAAAEDSRQEPMKPSGAMQAAMGDDLKDFFETAASANMLEIESGKLAVERATDPKLKEFGQKMVTDHTKASEELKSLAQAEGATLPTRMLKRHQMMLDDLRGEKQGEAFDDEFRDKMVASHKEAVSLFDQTAKQAKDPEVKAFAAKMLPKLQEHGTLAKNLEGHGDKH